MKIAPMKIRGMHPYSFRSGEWARVVGTAMFQPEGKEWRPCFHVIYQDGVGDYVAISDKPNYELAAIGADNLL